jgi:hypothetical protein
MIRIPGYYLTTRKDVLEGKIVKRKNVYFGDDSVAGIKLKDNVCDTFDEYLAVLYAFFVDLTTPPYGYVLSHEEYNGRPVLVRLTRQLLNGRIFVLNHLASRLGFNSMKRYVRTLEDLFLKGKVDLLKRELYEFARDTGTLDLLHFVVRKIAYAKQHGVIKR